MSASTAFCQAQATLLSLCDSSSSPPPSPLSRSRQVPSRPFLPEEDEPGEPAASYSYALAEAAAKARGTMEGHEVGCVRLRDYTTGGCGHG
jgi:hypothetical protein